MFKRILVPVDLAEPAVSERTLRVATEMAEKYGAAVDVMTVVPSYGMAIVGGGFPKDFEKSAIAGAQVALKEFLSAHQAPAGVPVKGHVAHGTIYDEIMKVADKLDCDLIVMASHRPALKDYLLGPNAARVVRHARQSVFVVREAR